MATVIQNLDNLINWSDKINDQFNLDALKTQTDFTAPFVTSPIEKQKLSLLRGKIQGIETYLAALRASADEDQKVAPPRAAAAPIRNAQNPQDQLFCGTVNQYETRQGVRPGVSACPTCALSLLQNLWTHIQTDQRIDGNLIDRAVREGIDARIQMGNIEQHVPAAEAADRFPALQYQYDSGFIQAAEVLDPATQGRATLTQDIQNLERLAFGTLIGAIITRGNSTHMILIDGREPENLRYYLGDSHGNNRSQNRAFIRSHENRDQFVGQLLELDPYDRNPERLQVGQQNPNGYQMLVYSVDEPERAPEQPQPLRHRRIEPQAAAPLAPNGPRRSFCNRICSFFR